MGEIRHLKEARPPSVSWWVVTVCIVKWLTRMFIFGADDRVLWRIHNELNGVAHFSLDFLGIKFVLICLQNVSDCS